MQFTSSNLTSNCFCHVINFFTFLSHSTEVEIVEPEYQIVKDVIQSMRDEGIHVRL